MFRCVLDVLYKDLVENSQYKLNNIKFVRNTVVLMNNQLFIERVNLSRKREFLELIFHMHIFSPLILFVFFPKVSILRSS